MNGLYPGLMGPSSCQVGQWCKMFQNDRKMFPERQTRAVLLSYFNVILGLIFVSFLGVSVSV